MTVDAERRKKLRRKPLSLVYVELPPGNGGMMRDLSEEGFAMRVMIPLRAGEQTSFAFSLDEFTRIEGQGLVDWIEENGRVVGVKFAEIPESVRDKLDEWLLRSDEPPTSEEESPPVAPTLEELREELRTTPPRPLPPTKEEVPSPETDMTPAVSDAPSGEDAANEDASSTQLPESAPSPPHEDFPFPLEPVEHLSVSEENTELPVAPSVPQEPAPETQPASVLSTIERKWRLPASSPPPEAEAPASDPPLPERDPNLPHISSILIQPARISSGHGSANVSREQFSNRDAQTVASYAPWTENFTLSSAVSVMFLLVLTVGIYVFHREVGQGLIWLGERMGGGAEGLSRNSVPDQRPSSDPPVVPVPGSNPPQTGLPSGQQVIPKQPAADSTSAPATGAQPSHSLPSTASPSPAAPASAPEPGQTEYSQAVQLLRANSGVGTGDAVQLLWISVEKGNPNAEIALADLYWHGKGVPKNCDQTRILLAAAARKANPEAHRRLQQFQEEGCE